MSDSVLVYRGESIAAYGFGDPHPFGTDRHDVFHAELDKAGLDNGDTPAVPGIYDAASAVVRAVLCAVDEVMNDAIEYLRHQAEYPAGARRR